VTTLAVNALGEQETQNSKLKTHIRSWLLKQQYRSIHPYTHAAPGGWAWTDLPGGVPDADDTAGALLALRKLGPINDETREAAIAGLTWLLDLQNRDGGIPTFCRGWGALPFDQSSADITAHAVRAWLAWEKDVPELKHRLNRSIWRAGRFLFRSIRRDGSWLPLWFGNQWNPGDENPVYGTARVVVALSKIPQSAELKRGVTWLVKAQLPDGGWGAASPGEPSIEETALAVEALTESLCEITDAELRESATKALTKGCKWLLDRVESGEWTKPSPIGFYFAKLWYYERLYPMIFTVGALNKVKRVLQS